MPSAELRDSIRRVVTAAVVVVLGLPVAFWARDRGLPTWPVAILVVAIVLVLERFASRKRRAPVPSSRPTSGPPEGLSASAAEESLFRAIEQQRAKDPLIGAKVGSKEMTQRILGVLKSEQGVHFETALGVFAAFAGYACQASVRAAAGAGVPDAVLFVNVTGSDGSTYFSGDRVNEPLVASPYSVISVLVGAAQQQGCAEPVDVEGAFAYCAATVGSREFGRPRDVPERLGLSMVDVLRDAWAAYLPLVKRFCPDPRQWPILYAMSAQQILTSRPAEVDPCVALRFAMDIAIAMSKVDLKAGGSVDDR